MCKDHAAATMIHVNRKLCIGKNDTCVVSATYNFPDQKGKGLYCVSCKLPNMIDVTSRRCIVEGCAKRPFYNVPREKPNYCSDHMDKETMINVSNPRCLDCDQYPAFNFPGKSAIYCAEHRKPDMINVICKYCAEDGCNKVPVFNFKGEKALYCGDHKKDGMVDVKSKKCAEDGCDIYPQYNFPGTKKRIYCFEHKKDGMVHTGYPQCVSTFCLGYGHDKYKGHCLRCFVYLFPDEPITHNYKVKERHVADFIARAFPNYKIMFDTRVDGGCSRRRPDCMFDCFTHIVIIEIDENQHKSYDTTCEIQRLNELFTDLGDRPIIFIRFNPDGYKDASGKKHASPFDYTKVHELPVVKDKTELNARFAKLGETVQWALETVPTKPVSVVSLFFDGYAA